MTATAKNILPALFFLLSIACNVDSSETFSYKLRGTWMSNSPECSGYDGILTITYNTINIEGYIGTITCEDWYAQETTRPFWSLGLTQNSTFKGYDEGGYLYIQDRGQWMDGIPFDYWEDAVGQKFLSFTFDGREELLRKIDE